MALIKVKVIQAHSRVLGVGKWKNYKAGEVVDIDESHFSPNLYERLSEVKDKEDKGDDTRTKKR